MSSRSTVRRTTRSIAVPLRAIAAILLGLWIAWGQSSTLLAQGDLPPRPTVTPAFPTPPAAPLGHIVLRVEEASVESFRDGLWSVVQWQGGDGVWHDVPGWRGWTQGDSQRWAVRETDFGKGPFRWVVYAAPGGTVIGISERFDLPNENGEEVNVTLSLDSRTAAIASGPADSTPSSPPPYLPVTGASSPAPWTAVAWLVALGLLCVAGRRYLLGHGRK